MIHNSDISHAPAPFDEGPSDRQLAELLPLLLAEDQRFWFLAAEGTDEVESFVRLSRLALPGDRRVESERRLARVLRDLRIPPARSPRMPKCPGSGWRAVADQGS